ncbi:hypothetical protein GCM10010967_00550 [Dyadobacter beijingensis]|uniref:Uncharacterized protein n=1 Tax=Dyadobacter beijingensis TaxID=365489 RepID=A0ABQ2HDI4_9BACT|nr:hypothetical protein [Dyadobacter beijingensis]GGM72979.1 hypothetical protein GCM10010967_00550 [Dyadobacter beijingensis]
MEDIPSLWPNDILDATHVLLPVTILNEQARQLGQMTRNVLLGDVSTQKIAIGATHQGDDVQPGILNTLKVAVPAFGNYDFDLVRVVQESFLPYPATIYAPLIDSKYTAENSDQLIEILRSIFSHKSTVETFQSLILQSRSA